MGLIKPIELENGITLNYHRITSINSITNILTIIEVSSYISEAKRLEEKTYQELQMKQNRTLDEEEQLEKGIDVYINTEYIQMPYDKNTNIDNVYKYLKTLDKYKNSQDI